MKPLLFGALAGALLCTSALAQPQRGGDNTNFGAQNGAVFQLPQGVQNIVSIDALNTIIIASDGEQPGQTRYTPLRIKHVYSGGIARLFGGLVVPTAQFATPGAFVNGANGNQNGNNNGGVATVGGNNNAGFQNNNGGFGGGFQNNNGSFGGGGFGGGGFQNGALRGNGFDTLRRNDILNALVRAR